MGGCYPALLLCRRNCLLCRRCRLLRRQLLVVVQGQAKAWRQQRRCCSRCGGGSSGSRRCGCLLLLRLGLLPVVLLPLSLLRLLCRLLLSLLCKLCPSRQLSGFLCRLRKRKAAALAPRLRLQAVRLGAA